MGKRRRQQQSAGEQCDVPGSRDGEQTNALEVDSDVAVEPTCSSSKRQTTDGPFSEREVKAFIRDGFVLLKDAFAQETAAKCRELVWQRLEQDGICKSNPETWVERHGIAGAMIIICWGLRVPATSGLAFLLRLSDSSSTLVYFLLWRTAEIYDGNDDPVWNDVLTPRLQRAVDQLCGKRAWEKFGCGWWMVTFPNQSEPPWDAAGKWHVDGASYQHHIDSRESGLLAIFCFSDIEPTEGGTALSAGSHVPIARLLEKNKPSGLKGGAVSFNARKFPRQRVVEVNGKAGDIMLVHPFLLHARSKNLGQKGIDSVRIMCNPNIRLHKKMNLNRADGAYSPVEQAIVDALKKKNKQ